MSASRPRRPKPAAPLPPAAGRPVAAGAVRWQGWQRATSRERVKPGVQPYVDAMARLGR